MPTDLELLTELKDCSMFEEANEMNLKQFRKFVIHVPEDSQITADNIIPAIKNMAGIA
jgi:hypothetical protein